MAGRPRLRALEADIAKDGGDIAVFSRIIDGDSIATIARRYGVERKTLYDWRNRKEERKQLWEEAMKLSAETLVEQGEGFLEDLTEYGPHITSAQVALAVARSKYKQWQAGVRDKETFGDKKGAEVNVNLNLGLAHLQALKSFGRMEVGKIEEAEVELLEAGEDE